MPTSAQPYEVNVKNATLAISLEDLNTGLEKMNDLSRVVQPVFFTATRNDQGEWFNKKYYEAVPCEDIFGEMIDHTPSLGALMQ